MCWKKLGNDAGFGGVLLYWGCGKMGFAKKAFVVYVGTIWGRGFGGFLGFFFQEKYHSQLCGGGGKKRKQPVLPCSSQLLSICYACRVLEYLLVPGKTYPKTGRVSKYWRPDMHRLSTHTSLRSLFFGCAPARRLSRGLVTLILTYGLDYAWLNTISVDDRVESSRKDKRHRFGLQCRAV